MAGIKELRQRKAELIAEGNKLLAEPKTDAGEARFLAVEKELDEINVALARAERFADEERAMAGLPVEKPAEAKGFATFGEQLGAVVVAARGEVDRRLSFVAASGASEGIASDGGYLVQPEFSSEIVRHVFAGSEILNRIRKLPVSGNNLTIHAVAETSRATGSRWGGVRAYWKGEGGQATATRGPKLREMKLSLKKLMGLAYATDELLEDAPAMEALITQAIIEEFRWLAEEAVINGTGVGEPLGIRKSGAVVTVAKEANQAADTIVAANVLKMLARTPPGARAGLVWLVSPDAEPQLPQLTIGSQPVYLPPGGLSGTQLGTLLGKPVLPDEHCETVGDEGDIMLLDLSQYVWIEKAIQAASSMHVKFDTDEMAFRFVWRCDGQPTWDSAVSPAKGNNTISPFVTLAARA